MHLLIVHYHWRPGGVRRVVETALGHLAKAPRLGLRSLTLAAGHPPPGAWAQGLRATLGRDIPLQWVTDPHFAYASEWAGGPADHRAHLTETAIRLLHQLPEPRTVLLQNPAVGRHPLLAHALADACAATGSRLVCHHHDFFIDGRWDRWPEWTACGIGSLTDALAAALPADPHVTHLAVSARDAAWLGPYRPTLYCPNPVAVLPRPSVSEVTSARFWLEAAAGTTAAVWLCPTRVLRRKNLAEAVLVARLLAPTAVVATTGGVSSPGEARYAQALTEATGSIGRALRIGLLETAESEHRGPPAMAALMAASERVIVSSLFEGYGLPIVEATVAGGDGLARREACPDGRAPGRVVVYDEVMVPWEMAGGSAERKRQETAWVRWQSLLPADAAAKLPEPPWWRHDALVPFSRLTLRGQLDILRACKSLITCASLRDLNPTLAERHSTDPPVATPPVADPPTPDPPAFTLAECLLQPSPPTSVSRFSSPLSLLNDRLPWANHYPLLWPGGDEPSV